MPKKYINQIIAYEQNTNAVFALCYDCRDGRNLCCYPVVKYEQYCDAPCIDLYDTKGSTIDYRVGFTQRIKVPCESVKCIVSACPINYITLLHDRYHNYAAIAELKTKHDALYEEYRLGGQQSKQLRKEMNKCNRQIRELEAKYAPAQKNTKKKSSTKRKQGNNYSNYRYVPNKSGYVKIYGGGGCSGK